MAPTATQPMPDILKRTLELLCKLVPARFRTDIPVVPVVRLSGVIGVVTPLRPGLMLSSTARSLERAFSTRNARAVAPSLRNLYFTKTEAIAYQDADEYAERHRLAAEQLIEQERRSRTQGEALDEAAMQRISSFLKSYAEMRKGEQFVMSEVRARARERVRWSVSLGLLAAALLLAPLPWRRLWTRLSR